MRSSTGLISGELNKIDDWSLKTIEEANQSIADLSHKIIELHKQLVDITANKQPYLEQIKELQNKINSINSVIIEFESQQVIVKEQFCRLNFNLKEQTMRKVELLRTACFQGNINLVDMLLKQNTYGPTGQIYYSIHAHCDVKKGDPINLTLLKDDVEILSSLLTSNLVNLKGREETVKTSIQFEAVRCDAHKCALFLLNECSDINASEPVYEYYRTWDGTNGEVKRGEILGLALHHSMPDAAELYIKKGANVNQRYGNRERSHMTNDGSYYQAWDGSFNTAPLLIAAEKGYVSTVKLLLEYGADPSIKDDHGNTAFNLTTNSEIKRLLTKPTSLRERYESIPGHGPAEQSLISMISHRFIRDPVLWNGILFCREDLREINQALPDDKKVGPLGEPITKTELDAIMAEKTFEPINNKLIQLVDKEEEQWRQRQMQKFKM